MGRWSSSWSSACHVFSGCVFLIIVIKPSVLLLCLHSWCWWWSCFLSLCRVHMLVGLLVISCLIFLLFSCALYFYSSASALLPPVSWSVVIPCVHNVSVPFVGFSLIVFLLVLCSPRRFVVWILFLFFISCTDFLLSSKKKICKGITCFMCTVWI